MTPEERKKKRLEDLKRKKCASFEKILEEVRAVASSKEEEERLLKERIVRDLVEFHARKAAKRLIKRENNEEEKEMPREFKKRISEMEGTDVVLVIQKQYPRKTGLSCLSIPETETRLDFLNGMEKKELQVCDEGIEVLLIEPCLEESKAWLKKQNTESGDLYVFALNGVVIGTTVQLWSFRIKETLCFALVKLN
ncbi:B3 domain-containing protein At2g24670 [Alnus glutinosa]|uniref:B3 domain-containing protein At2g24670 n=1 Tax=Alnus glutinosa TaxID=3517 RepID=UPI002D7A2158|nr:B3 domain-containing protein At2g24670 [Alnus glutinosa]